VKEKTKAGAWGREKGSAGNDEKSTCMLYFFPSTWPLRILSQACSQGVTVGGLCRQKRLQNACKEKHSTLVAMPSC